MKAEGNILSTVSGNRLEITSSGRLPVEQSITRIIQEVTDAGLAEPEFLGGDTDSRINIYRGVLGDGNKTGLQRKAVPDAGKVPESAGLMPDYSERCRISAGKVPEKCRTLIEQQTRYVLAEAEAKES